jgi:tetratricopeptide (TPR) repeat protein
MVGLESDAEHALAQVGVDPRAALAEADAIVARIPRPRTPHDVREVATAHRAAGLALRSMGEPAAGEKRMRRGIALAERHDERDVAAEVRMSLAFVLLDLGRSRAALTATDLALGVLRDHKAARVRTIRALVLQSSGRDREAYAEYDAALRALHRAKDEDWEARLRHNRALLSIELGRTREAISDLEWTRAYDLRAGHTADAADALFNMGVALEDAGDIPGALELFDRADHEWQGVERPERWGARVDAYLAVGLIDEATHYARLQLEWLRGRGWDALEADVEVSLAQCLLSSSAPQLDEAERHARRATSMLAVQGRTDTQALAQYVLLKTRLLASPTEDALDAVPGVAAILRDAGRDGAAADLRVTAGQAALELPDAARGGMLLGPLTAQVAERSFDVRTRAWFARALLSEADGDDRGADAALRRAWRVVEVQRSLLGATELRAASARHAEALVRTGARVAVRRGSAVGVFDWAERSRAAVLRRRPTSPPRDPELAEALARLRWAARNEEELQRDGESDQSSSSLVARSESAILRVTRRAAGGLDVTAPVSLSDVRAHLRQETFVQFLTVDGGLVAVVADRRSARLVAVGAVEDVSPALETTLFGLRRILTGFGSTAGLAATSTAVENGLNRLDGLLLAPLDLPPERDSLVVCPSATLTAVPWSALPSLRGRAVRVAPSATSWCQARDRVARAGGVLAAAGPGLAGAADEVRDIGGVHPDCRVLVGDDATASRVLSGAATARVLHIAAHGQLRTDNPLFSALRLSDGPLTGYDLESLERVPESVILSACNSGAGQANVAEETLGLAWVLLGLGAVSVVAPLLPIPDTPTRDLMVALHRYLARGLDAADALARARDDHRDDPLITAVAAAFVSFGG